MFDCLLCKRETILQDHIKVLQELAVNTDKEVKIGATVRALGVAAAVGTVLFAALTRRVSLPVAAVGVVAFRVSTTIISRIHIRKKVEKKLETVLNEHSTYIEEIERCVKFIVNNVACLKKYNMSALKSVSVTRVVQVAGALGPLSKSSGLIQGFRLGMNIYLIKDDSGELKKGTETKFAKQIPMLAKQMQASLHELMKIKTVVESADM